MPGSKQKRRKSPGQLSTVYPLATGIDVGATAHVVAVPRERDDRPVRTFQTFSADLHRLAQWLGEVGITTVAMESTGVYWVPVFEILEAHGFEVLLVNARDVKNVPGRKTDVNDAQWLQQLHQHGLLRGSFRPRDGIVQLRAYLRHRERLVDYAASHIQHMQKALMQMNIQLQHVVTDITGVTGMRIIRAIVSGIHAPQKLAEFRDVRCAASPQTIVAALSGNYRSEHLFALRQALELYDFHQAKITERDVGSRRLCNCSTRNGRLRKNHCPACGMGRAGTNRASTRDRHFILCWAPTSRRSMDSVLTQCSGWWPNAETICASGPPPSISHLG
jgi:transposase